MSISRQNLSIVIVTFKSESVIHDCIRSIGNDIDIIVVDNSNNLEFKEKLEKIYTNVSCLLSEKNLGMGAGNNIGIKNVKTDYVLILNPDVILENSTINELILASQKIPNFAILAPISSNVNYPNYKFLEDEKKINENKSPFKVKSIDGFAMLFNKKRLDEIINKDYFDENFFMYLENDDLCKRIRNINEDIFIVPTSKIKHLGGKAVDIKYKDEIELSRNWHWIWSKFYFNKKHSGYTKAFMLGFPKFLSSITRYLFYCLTKNQIKKKIYKNRVGGFFNAAKNNSSWYRPNNNF
ncbi:glycosyltransferase family 2 protein [Candidatus Pelagibacter sp.]|nr:glycosyltransferase family 2 protein [Candidatus Pelagibacter sp.]